MPGQYTGGDQNDGPSFGYEEKLKAAQGRLARSEMLAARSGGGAVGGPVEPAVGGDINDLMGAIDRLDSYVTELQQRLNPLCRPEVPTPDKAMQAQKLASRSPFGLMVRVQTDRLRAVGWVLHDLLDRLEV